MPLSVQELLAKKAAADGASRKEREAQREQEKEAEAAAELERLQRTKRARHEWEAQAARVAEQPAAPEKPKEEAKHESPAPEARGDTPDAPDTESSAIKQRYLGVRPDRKTGRKKRSNDPSKRFNFEWDQEEDTSDLQQLAYVPAQTGLLAGRAGLDGSERAGSSRRTALKSTLDEKHWTEKPLSEMKARDWRIFREDYGIVAKGGHIPHPLRSWRESAISPAVLEAIEEIGYKEPSPIQRQAIPIGLENRDLIGIAETGSGKTASFVIPMLSYVARLPRLTEENAHLGPYALIMSPTRELAQQIEAEARKLVSRLGFNVVSVVGGRDITEQAFYLQRGAEIVIATPGRLKDLIEQRIVMLGQCTYLVMDEADRMVDMNYEAELDYILGSLPSGSMKPDGEAAEQPLAHLPDANQYRVTMLYSATMPPYVEKIARTYLRRPATVIIGNAGQAVGTVEQQVEFVEGEEKRKYVQQLTQKAPAGCAGLWSGAPHDCLCEPKDDRRYDWPRLEACWSVLHSGLSQSQREAAIGSLRDGRNEVLCCTDIGARGIDLPDVSLVVNYQFPTNFSSYIHRIGRTGRAGKQGRAVSFLDEDDAEHFFELKQEISKSPVSQLPAELARHPAAQTKPSAK